MRQSHQLGVLVQRVVRASRSRVQATDEHQAINLAAKHLEKHDERALAIAPHAVRAVLVVGVNSQAHGAIRPAATVHKRARSRPGTRSRPATRARWPEPTGGPNRAIPTSVPRPQPKCMIGSTTASIAPSAGRRVRARCSHQSRPPPGGTRRRTSGRATHSAGPHDHRRHARGQRRSDQVRPSHLRGWRRNVRAR